MGPELYNDVVQRVSNFTLKSKPNDYILIVGDGGVFEGNLAQTTDALRQFVDSKNNNNNEAITEEEDKETSLAMGMAVAINARAISLLTRLYVMTSDFPKLANSKTVKEIERFFNQG